MTPLPSDPTVVVLVHPGTGKPVAVATNVAPDLKIETVTDLDAFDALAKNKPFRFSAEQAVA